MAGEARSTFAPAAATVPATVGAALAAASSRLAAAGCDTPRLDAELLLAQARACDRARLVIDRDERLGDAEAGAFALMLARREQHEPVAYILGRRDFRHLTLAVDARVLIPRPETELLVELALGLSPGARVLDVGTGSGAIALALKQERPDLAVRGVDVDPAAVEVAQDNARALELDVSFAAADLLDDLDYDVILANLPYVPVTAALPPDVAGHEPAGALFSGPDGLDHVRRLIERLASRGPLPEMVALEIGPEQAQVVAGLLRNAGFAGVRVHRDLARRDRVVEGRAAAATDSQPR